MKANLNAENTQNIRSRKHSMIYTLEKRYEFGYGTMTTFYGLFKHEKRYSNDVLTPGTLVKRFTTKDKGLRYCGRYNIALEEVDSEKSPNCD